MIDTIVFEILKSCIARIHDLERRADILERKTANINQKDQIIIICILLLCMFNYHIYTLNTTIAMRDDELIRANNNYNAAIKIMARMNDNQTYMRDQIGTLEYQLRTYTYEVEYHKSIAERFYVGNYSVIVIESTTRTCNCDYRLMSARAAYTLNYMLGNGQKDVMIHTFYPDVTMKIIQKIFNGNRDHLCCQRRYLEILKYNNIPYI